MPAGSGSRPSSASSGAVESECQHEAEADDFDGYADEDGTDDINDIDDIDDIFQTMVWASMRVIVIVGIVVIVVMAVIVIGAIAVIVVIFVRTYACMLLLLMVALMVSHPCWPQPHETRVETDETMKLLLASAP